MKARFLHVLILFSVLLISKSAIAGPVQGAEITYECTGSNTYEITLTAYEDCSGPGNLGTSQTITWNGPSCGTTGNITVTASAPTELQLICPTGQSTCQGGTSPGIRKYIFKGNVTLPASCTNAVFGWTNCCRPNSNTLTAGQGLYVEAVVDMGASPCNNSPVFLQEPLFATCANQNIHYNNAAYDADGDSLVYSLVSCQSNAGTSVAYITPFSATNPITTASGISLDNSTGEIQYRPTATGLETGFICIQVDEFRNGNKIGTITRDVRLGTTPCASNTLPVLSGVNGGNTYQINVCENTQVCFTMNASDANASNSLDLNYDNSIPAATFTQAPAATGNGITGTFCWTPTNADIGKRAFTVKVSDDACNLTGREVYTYLVNVTANANDPVNAGADVSICSNDSAALMATTTTTGATYTWSPTTGLSSASIANPKARPTSTTTYQVTATYPDGCTYDDDIQVSVVSGITTSINASPIPCAGGVTSITVGATGGTGSLTYIWSGGSSGGFPTNQDVVNGATAGIYNVTVSDGTGCSASTSITITEPSAVTATIISQVNVDCFGENTGQIEMAGNGGDGTYTYQWDAAAGGQTTGGINTLGAGVYCVTVEDGNACSDDVCITITQPASALVPSTVVSSNHNGQDIRCFGETNGEATATGTGGTPGGFIAYFYQWSANAANQTTSAATGLGDGKYYVTVTDSKGCVAEDSVVLVEPAQVMGAIINRTNVSCFATATGTATVNPGGGVAPYTFFWGGGLGQTTATATGMAAGTYCVDITDASGCINNTCVAITQPATPLALTNLSTTDPNCHGALTGTASIAVGGGTPPYKYTWGPNGQTTSAITGLGAGVYSILVEDNLGCTLNRNITITEPSATTITESLNHVVCHGASTGSITVTAAGGTGAHTFSWGPNTGNQTIPTVTGLSAGVQYCVTATDGNSCPSSECYLLTQPSNAFSANIAVTTNYNGFDVTCIGATDGRVKVNATGGTPGYNYLWSTGSVIDSINNVGAGSYSVTLTDANSCQTTASITVTNPPAVSATIPNRTNVTCFGGSDGSAMASGAGGTGVYTFAWSNGQTTAMATGLQASTPYTVTVTDGNGCTHSTNVTLTQGSFIPKPTIGANKTSVCVGDSINLFTTTTGVAGYQWTGPASFASTAMNPSIPIAVPANGGNYMLRVVDASGCTSADTMITIQVNSLPISPTITGGGDICFGDSIVLEEVGGAICDSMSWVGPTQPQLGIVNQVIVHPGDANYATGIWTMHCVNTTTGCYSVSNAIYVNLLTPIPTPAPTSNAPICVGDSLTLSVPAVLATNVTWFSDAAATNSIGFSPTITVPNIISDTTFYVRYKRGGCYSTLEPINITPNALPLTPDAPANFAVCEGQAINLFTNAVATTYEWTHANGFASNSQFVTIAPATIADSGVYTLRVLDNNGCSSNDTTVHVTVNPTPAVPSIVTSNSPVCKSDTLRLNSGGPCGITRWTAPNGSILNGANVVIAPDSTDFVGGAWTMLCIDVPSGCESAPATLNVVIDSLPQAPSAYNNGPVCAGDSVTLGVSLFANANYTWFASDSITVVGTVSTPTLGNMLRDTFFFVRVEVNGCSEFDSTVVRVHPPSPKPDVPANFTVCEGQPIALSTSTTATSYLWTHPSGATVTQQNPTIPSATLADNGTYTLGIVDLNGCAVPDTSLVVTVNAQPGTPTITGGITCTGDSLVLIATGGCTNLQWMGPSGVAITGTDTLVVPVGDPNYVNNGNWTAVCVDILTGCLSNPSPTYTAVINANPATPTPVNNGPVCYGESVQLNTTTNIAGATYTWYTMDSVTIVGTTSLTNVPNLTMDTAFLLVATLNGCSSSDTTQVTVHPQPAAPPVPDTVEVCFGDTIFLMTAPATSYLWTGPNGFTSTIQNPFIPDANSLKDGYYNLIVKDANSCASLDTNVRVIVHALPTAPVISAISLDVCTGDTIFINSDRICDSLNWRGPSNTLFLDDDSIEIIPGTPDYQSGAWTVFCVDTTTGCRIKSNDININLQLTPANPIITQSGPVCQGDTVNLYLDPVAGATYEWYTPNNVLIGVTLDISVPNIVSDTSFNVFIDVNGCRSTGSVNVLNHPTTPAPDISIDDDTICQGFFIQLRTNTTASAYNWSGPNGFTSTLQNPFVSPANPINSGTYMLNITDANGCASADTSVVALVHPIPAQPVISGTTDICTGDTIVLTTSGCDTLTWFPLGGQTPIVIGGDSVLIIAPGSAYYGSGTWQVSCRDAVTGCESQISAPHTVTIHSLPNPVVASNNGPVCLNESVVLTVPAQPASVYYWSTDSLFNDTIGTGTTILVDSIVSDSIFYVQVTTANGCSRVDTTLVSLSPIPSIASISALNDTICEGEDIIVFATSATGLNYNWTGPNGFVSNQQVITITTAVAAQSGYYVVNTSNASGCTSPSDSIFILVNAPPTPPVVTGGNNICDGDTIVLTGTGTCDSTLWVGPQGPLSGVGNQLIIPPLVTQYTNTDWTLLCYDTTTGCSSISNKVFVTLLPSPSEPTINALSEVCNGDSIVLSTPLVVGAINNWYADSLLNIPLGIGDTIVVYNLTTDTTFYIEQTVNGCTAPLGSELVTVHPTPPPPAVSATITVCRGDSIFLTTTTPGDAYAWTGPNGFTSNVQNPIIPVSTVNHAGTYTLNLIDTNGCAAPPVTVVVTVNPTPPTPNISHNAIICATDTMNLWTSSQTSVLIEWISPNNDTLIGTPGVDILPNHPAYLSGLWTLQYTDTLTGCQISEDSVINIDVPPISGGITTTSPVCVGDSVTLSTTALAGIVTYRWFIDSFTVAGIGQTATIPNIVSDTFFGLVVTNAAGCSYFIDSTTVLVQPHTPAPPVMVDTMACIGDIVQMNTAPAAGYNWTGPNGFTSTIQNPVISPLTAANAGQYTLSIVDLNGCPSQDSVFNIHVNAAPGTPIVTGTATVCDGDTLFLSASGMGCDSIYWIVPVTNAIRGGSSIAIPPTSPHYRNGDWQAFCLDTTSTCATGSALFNVTIEPVPTAIASSNSPVCEEGSVTLTAGFVAGATYVWSTSPTLSDTIGTTQVITVDSIIVDSTFYLVVTGANGCASTIVSTLVTLHPVAPAPNIGPDVRVCEGENIVLTTPVLALGYEWTGPNGFTSNQRTPTITNATLANAGTYTFAVIGLNGCVSDDTTLNVVVDPLPATPSIPGFTYACQGDTLFLSADSTSSHCDSIAWIGPNGLAYPVIGQNVAIPPTDTNYRGGLWRMHCIDTATGCKSLSNFSIVIIAPTPTTQPTTTTGPVCIGDSVTLMTANAGAYTSYTWYADASLTIIAGTGDTAIVNNIVSDTVFYLVITALGGCESPPIATPVLINPLGNAPVVPADTQVCVGDSIVLNTSTSAAQYFWTGINGFADTVQNPVVTGAASVLDSGTYTLTVLDAHGCLSNSASFHITVNALPPSPNIFSNSPICDGDTLQLSASGQCGQSQWIGPNGNSPAVLGTPGGGNPLWTLGNTTAIPPNNSSYSNSNWYMVCIDTLTGCRATSDTISVAIVSNMAINSVTNSGPVCGGGTVTLTANAISSGNHPVLFNWYDNPALTTPIATGGTATIPNVTATTTFYVEAIDTATGCSALDSTIVTVHPTPATPNVPNNMVLCEGDSIILSTSTAAVVYNWTGPNGFTSTVQYPPAFVAGVLDSGTYTLVVTDANGCISGPASVHITVNPQPAVPVVLNNSPGCIGGTITLSASAISGVVYEWFKLPTNTSIGFGQNLNLANVTMADAGTYYVTASANGCTSTSDTTVVTIVNSNAPVADAGNNQDLCGQDTVTLFGTVPSLDEVGLWTSSSSATIVNPTSSTTLVANLSVGTHVFYWTLTNTICTGTATDSVVITVAPPSIDSAFAGVDQNLCGVTTATLAATVPVVSSGTWIQDATQAAAGVIITNPNDPASTITGLVVGNAYTFVWELSNGVCGVHANDTVVITVNIAPSAAAIAGNDIITCNTDTIVLGATAPSVGTGLWTTNSSAVIISPNQPNTIVTNLQQDTTQFIWTLSNNACADYAADTMLVILGGATPIAHADSFNVNSGAASTVINVTTNDNLTSSWDIYINTPMNSGQMVNLNNGQFDLDLQGVTTSQSFIYELCNPACPANCDTAIVIIEVNQVSDCDIPNIFTPNGDGVNDLFTIPCINVEGTMLLVFNRWGDLVYETDSYLNQWDGTHNGEHLPDGTYFYVIKIGDQEELQGSVEIRR